MRLSEIVQHCVTETYPVGTGFSLTWDANKFSAAHGRRMAQLYRERSAQFRREAVVSANKVGDGQPAEQQLADRIDLIADRLEQNAQIEELEKEIYADVLACDRFGILTDWDLEDDADARTKPTFQELMKFPAGLVADIYKFTREESGPKGQRAVTTQSTESQTTSSHTNDGSLTQAIPTQTDQTTSET
jgi:hypothetical protein